MDDKTIQGIAHTHATGLCIVDNALAHLKVAKLVEVGMHDSRTGLYNRHLGIVAHEINQPSTATGNTYVNISHGIEHLGGCLVCGFQEVDYIRIDTVSL